MLDHIFCEVVMPVSGSHDGDNARSSLEARLRFVRDGSLNTGSKFKASGPEVRNGANDKYVSSILYIILSIPVSGPMTGAYPVHR